jgi:phosphoenolpyruvate-protein kinase (PTS system EI component)
MEGAEVIAFLLNPRVLIVLAVLAGLAFSHFTAYRKGAANVRAEWSEAVSVANKEARALEQARQRRADESAALAASRANRIAADAARLRRESDGLRHDLDAIGRASAESLSAANNAVRALGDVFEQCVREYSSVAESADRATSEVKHLRDAWPK